MASEVAMVLQGLECSLCFNLLEEPKQLSCTHSFCKECLQQLYHFQGMPTDLKCPFCRQITRLGKKGLSDLKTNIPLKSMVGDLKTSRKWCTLCDPEAKSPVIRYCQQCDEYMCETCLLGHSKYRKNANHMVVSVDDIKSGKVKVKQMCHEHPGEERLWVCTSCKVSICFRCRILYHGGSDHLLFEVDDLKKNMKEEIESLKKKGSEKLEKIKSYTKVVRELSVRVEAIIAEREADINKAFDMTILQLNAKKNDLLDRCRNEKMKLKEELWKHGKNGEDLITSISSACELVGNGVRAFFEGEALVVHNNLCKELQDMLDRDDPDESKPKQVESRAEAVTFTPCRLDDEHNLGMLNTSRAEATNFTQYRLDDEQNLGRLDIKDWKLEKVAFFPASGKETYTMAQTKNGKVLIGYLYGGIEEFTVSPQKTVLKDVKVRRVSALSDGCYIVRDTHENIALYSFDWNKQDINKFEMKSASEIGGMDVDKFDNIYIGYYYNKSINVFTTEGGAPRREIPCHGYQPYLIGTMNHSSMLVISNGYSVRVIDQQGGVKHDVIKNGYYARPAVLYDDSILIGWEKDGLVSIDLYTNQMRHVRTVISGLECNSGWWALIESSSEEIAFYSDSKFYVLRKTY